MIDHMSNVARADVLRAELKLATKKEAKDYLQTRIDELDPPRLKLPENPKNGDVIDAVFATDPAHPEHGVTLRLFRICGVWMTKHGYQDLNWPAIDHYDKVL